MFKRLIKSSNISAAWHYQMIALHKKMKFSADFFTFTEEILNEQLHFLRNVFIETYMPKFLEN